MPNPLNLILAPLNFGLQAGSMAVRVGLDLTQRVAGAVLPGQDDGQRVEVTFDDDGPMPSSHAPGAATVDPIPDTMPVPPVPDLGPAQEPAPDPIVEPVHVSEEPVVVAEFAEAGAENGAGAEIAIAEPWAGYDKLRVPEIERELARSEPEVAAAVKLYEAMGRARQGVMRAADRRLNA